MVDICGKCCLQDKKTQIAVVMKEHQEISKKTAELLLLKQRVMLLQIACDKYRSNVDKMNQELTVLTKLNNKREEKIKRAQSKDFNRKLMQAKSDCVQKDQILQREKQELFTMRRNFISQVINVVFPITLPSTGKQDEQVSHDPLIDYDVINNIDDNDWLLPIQPRPPPTHHLNLVHIGYGALPKDGNMTEYIKAVKQMKTIFQTTTQTTNTSSDLLNQDVDHLHDLTQLVPAAVSLIIHCTYIIANVLDQSLPYPMILPVALCEYGRADHKASTIIHFLTKLDDNIVFLCFTQDVPQDTLIVGQTLHNLSVLINHRELGRSGPFICYPELIHSPVMGSSRKYSLSSSEQNWDNEPPLLHVAESPNDTDKSPQSTESEDSDSDSHTLNIREGWEEVHDLTVPTHFLPGFHGDRLEYGTSYSEYSQQGLISESELMQRDSAQVSSGLLDTLSSLLGSGWTRK